MKNLLISFLSTGFIQLANLVTGILAARLLLPEGRGELALLLLWPVMVAELGSMGLNTAVVYKSARRETGSNEVFAATAWLTAAICPVLMAVYAAVVVLVFDGKRDEILSMAWICTAMIPLHLYSLSLVSQFQGEQRFGAFNILRSSGHIAYLALLLAFIAAGQTGVSDFAWAFIGALTVTVIAALIFAGRLGWPGLAVSRDTIADMFRYGVRVHVGNVLNIASRRLDQLLISVTLAVSDLGLYVVAIAVSAIPMMVTATTDLVAFPKMAEQDSDDGRQYVLGRYLRATLLIVAPCVGILIFAAPEFIGLLFGQSFVPAADVARVLLLSGIAFAFRTFINSYLRASNRMLIVSQVEGSGIAITAVALAVLVPLFGTMGAAIAQLLAGSLPVVLAVVLIRRSGNFDIAGLVRFRTEDFDVFRDLIARYRTGG